MLYPILLVIFDLIVLGEGVNFPLLYLPYKRKQACVQAIFADIFGEIVDISSQKNKKDAFILGLFGDYTLL